MATTEPFTQLVIYTEPNTNANTDHVSAWMQQEVSKNNELPPLPFEMWSHIVSFTVQKKWNNLIIIGDYILMTYRSGAKLNGTGPSVTGSCGIGAHMSSLNRFIKENKPNTINSIHQKTFGTTLADNRMQREIFSGRMTIQAVLTMA